MTQSSTFTAMNIKTPQQDQASLFILKESSTMVLMHVREAFLVRS
jgi:hypothetical protein